MSTTITNQPSDQPTNRLSDEQSNQPTGQRPVRRGRRPVRRGRRRVLLAVVVAGALGIGAGAAAASVISSGGATSHPAHPAVAVTPQVDVHALWSELVTLPARDQAAVVAALPPSVRGELRTLTEAIAATVEGR
jgi:hypothetical protein